MAEQQVAFVTGANRGIGLEIARQLSRAGFVLVLGSRDLEKGRQAAARLAADRSTPHVVGLDVTDSQSIEASVGEVLRTFGHIDVLVNNAAILHEGFSPEDSSVLDVSSELVDLTFRTNTLGPLLLTQAVLPSMKARGYGRIVNVSSRAGQLEEMGAGFPAYRISKVALNALTRITAGELGPGNIKVNAMCPGWVRTDMGGPNATRSVEEAAQTAVWLATLPEDGPTGGFFKDKKQIPW